MSHQQHYEGLFSPLPLAGKTAPNRFVFATHQTNFAVHNVFEQRHADYYKARAAGGVGTLVLEASVVHRSDRPYEYAVAGYDQRIVAGYQLVAEAVHQQNALVMAHLSHSGLQGSSHYTQLPLWAPSPVPEVNSRELPKVMEPEDIAEVVEGFRQTAAYVVEGGLDGIEINAGQDSLIRQFLSPLTNQRDDEYGGELANRMRFARQVIATIRQQVGKDIIVGLRLCADEHAPWAGLKPEDAVEIAGLLANDNKLDFISVTTGSIYSGHLTRPGLYAQPGFANDLAGGIKATVSLPVFTHGSLVDPAMASDLLAENKADAVEMTRALIADPEIPRKLKENRGADIRPCLLSNQDNIIGLVQNPRLSCVNNPAAGYEGKAEFAPLVAAPLAHQVMVIGGGPAGLEAARVAKLRGHDVTIYEQSHSLGGTLRLAAAAPGRERLALAVDWLEAQVRKLEIDIELGVEVNRDLVQQQAPDAIIMAVGGIAGHQPGVDFQSNAPVVNPRQVLTGEVPDNPGKAVVLDAIGDQIGMVVAEWLADRGWQVEVVTSDMFVGQRLTASLELTPWNQRACAKGIVFRPQIDVTQVSARTVIGRDHFDRSEIHIEDIDLVVDVCHEEPNETLYFALKRMGLRIFRAGDCVAPRYLSQAILEGYRVGREV